MKSDIIDNSKIVLRNRYNRLKTIDPLFLNEELIRFYNFICNNYLLKYIVQSLIDNNKDLYNSNIESLKNEEKIFCNTYKELSLLSICILENGSKIQDLNYFPRIASVFLEYKSGYPQNFPSIIIDTFIEPLVSYLDESVDDNLIILDICRKFKQKCECFNKEKLQAIYNNETNKGENNLAAIFYEFLFDAGLEIYIEPKLSSGRPDLILLLNNQKIISDAKLFDSKSKNKDYIKKAVNQLRTYLKEQNETIGFLLIYELCKESLFIKTKNKSMNFQYIEIDGKTIFFVIINIFIYGTSASKRGIASVIEIEESEFSS